jgi:hypothetical protein
MQGTERYTWDVGHIGLLRRWEAFAPDADTHTISVNFSYNNRGQLVNTVEALLEALRRSLTEEHHLQDRQGPGTADETSDDKS